jgi:hypothetical protein
VSSFEFPAERYLDTYAKETMINERDTRWTKSSEEVHSLGCVCQEEESWRKFGIVVGENEWVV